MTRDLDATLKELGPDYVRFASRLGTPVFPGVSSGVAPRRPMAWFWPVSALVAASLVAMVWFSARELTPSPAAGEEGGARNGEYAAAYRGESAIGELVAGQLPDGGWGNDFLTQQNAAALRGAPGVESLIAYKKAVRYLRSRGLKPLTDEQLRERGKFATRWRG